MAVLPPPGGDRGAPAFISSATIAAKVSFHVIPVIRETRYLVQESGIPKRLIIESKTLQTGQPAPLAAKQYLAGQDHKVKV